MTPAARLAAAIDVIDRIQGGDLADRALRDWGRRNRYAGSKDRAAIGDIVYDVLRKKLSLACLGGGETGRALVLGYVRASHQNPDDVFGSDRYAPAVLSDEERAWLPAEVAQHQEADFPEWLWADLLRSHGDKAMDVALALREKAPVHLRVNLRRSGRAEAILQLADEGVTCVPHDLSPSALEVTQGERQIRSSASYQSGLVELQDASSQAVADLVPIQPGQSVLDFCAGAGGKTLAVAARTYADFFAHDIEPRRMKDLAPRAARAGVRISEVSTADLSSRSYDTVLVDAPCSGSGSWRRDPQGKWLLTSDKLTHVRKTQRDILRQASGLVKPGGHLVYATCSLLDLENHTQVADFLADQTAFSLTVEQDFTPLSGSDGFYCAVLRKA